MTRERKLMVASIVFAVILIFTATWKTELAFEYLKFAVPIHVLLAFYYLFWRLLNDQVQSCLLRFSSISFCAALTGLVSGYLLRWF